MELQGSLKKWITAIEGIPDEVGPNLWGYQDDHAAVIFKKTLA